MGTDFGSSRWALLDELNREDIKVVSVGGGNLSPFEGFLLGRTEDPSLLEHYWEKGVIEKEVQRKYIYWSGEGHLLTIAPTRSGKGVGAVIPNLLNYPGSVVVLDPKGENYAVTSSFREKKLRQRIVCIDPFGVISGRSDILNPFDCILKVFEEGNEKESDSLLDDAALLANAMVVRQKDQRDPHWDDRAASVLKTMLLAVVAGLGRDKSLGSVRELLTRGRDDFLKLLAELENREELLNGLLARGSRDIQSMATEELASVMSSVMRHTEFLDSARARSSLSPSFGGSPFDVMDLKKSDKRVSVYLIMPPHYMAQYSRLMRVWLSMLMLAMTKISGLPRLGLPVLFMLDEIAQLGRLEILLQAVSLMGGYGATFWMIWQDIAQIKGLYPDEWPSFLANAKIQQFFGVNDLETAAYLYEMLGSRTISSQSLNEARSMTSASFSINKQNQQSVGRTKFEKERPLLMKDEIRRLPRQIAIILAQGCDPILSRRFTYYEDDVFSGRFSNNPCCAGCKKGGGLS